MATNGTLDCLMNPRRYVEGYKKFTIAGTTYLEFRDLKEKIDKYVKGKKTLDYGCGAGKSTVFLKSLGLDVTGVDIVEDFIKCASERDDRGSYQVITSGNVPADDNTYDLVFSCWVMPTVPTKTELSMIGKEISRILKPEGVFIMVVGNKNSYNNDWLTINTVFAENEKLYSGCRTKTLLKDINITLRDYFWTQEDYTEMIEDSNMTILEIHRPLGKDSDGYDWKLEKTLSPVDIYIAKKVNKCITNF